MVRRSTTVILAATALVSIGGASGSHAAPRKDVERMRALLKGVHEPVAGVARVHATDHRLRGRALAQLGRLDRQRIVFQFARRTMRPLVSDFSIGRCGRAAPNAISGFFTVVSELTGEAVVGDFFPSLNPDTDTAREWFVGMTNVTKEPRDWLGGAVCSQGQVRYEVFTSTVGPLKSDGGVIECPRAVPNAISGLFSVASETTGQLQLGDFLPALRGPRGKAKPRGWVVAVKNVTDRRQDWLGGVVCTRAPVRFSVGRGTLAPMESKFGTAACPRVAPNAVSGLSAIVTETPGDTLETGAALMGDFYPIPRTYRSTSREWGVGVKNVTTLPQEWIWGAMCMR